MKRIILVALALTVVGMLQAQTDEPISQRIEVTRQYVPELEGARKIDLKPQMTDTVTLKPDIKYSITPMPWHSVFGTKPIGAVGNSTAEYKREKPAYLMVGGGYPAQSTLDFRLGLPVGRDTRMGFYADHYGQWTRLENIFQQKERGYWTENTIGVHVSHDFDRRSLDFDFNYGLNYYMLLGEDIINTGLSATVFYNHVTTSLVFGDTFTDFSRFNYRVGMKGRFWGNLQGDTSFGNPLSDVFADFGWKWGKGVMLVGIDFDGWWSSGLYDWGIAFEPEYRFEIGRFNIKAGIFAYYDRYRYRCTSGKYSDGQFYILPEIEASYAVFDALVPYISFDGDVASGDYLSLAELNPYMYGYTARPKVADIRGGIRGDAGSVVAYDAYVGYLVGALPYFTSGDAAMGFGGLFSVSLSPVNWFYAGAGVEVRLPFGLGIHFGAKYNSYDTAGNMWSNGHGRVGMGIPDFTVYGTLSYNYRDRFVASVGTEVFGRRHFAACYDNYVGLPGTVNLKASLEYKTGHKFSIFLKGDNLLNQRIYRYLGYPDLGANVIGGIRLLF